MAKLIIILSPFSGGFAGRSISKKIFKKNIFFQKISNIA